MSIVNITYDPTTKVVTGVFDEGIELDPSDAFVEIQSDIWKPLSVHPWQYLRVDPVTGTVAPEPTYAAQREHNLLVQTAKKALERSDDVYVRTAKDGKTWTKEWKDYCEALREVVRGNSTIIPPQPEYPTEVCLTAPTKNG